MKKELAYDTIKTKCRLTDTEVEMAKKLHVRPETLLSSTVSAKSEKWKDPAALYLRRRYEECYEKEDLLNRESQMRRIGKLKKKDPMLNLARHLGFTRSECCMAKELGLTEDDLKDLEKKIRKSGTHSVSLTVRRMYEAYLKDRNERENEKKDTDFQNFPF